MNKDILLELLEKLQLEMEDADYDQRVVKRLSKGEEEEVPLENLGEIMTGEEDDSPLEEIDGVETVEALPEVDVTVVSEDDLDSDLDDLEEEEEEEDEDEDLSGLSFAEKLERVLAKKSGL